MTLYRRVVAASAAPLYEVAEFRGPERVLTPISDPDAAEPRVRLLYPAEALLPVRNTDIPGDSSAPCHDATKEWQRQVALLVGAMRAPAGDHQGIAGLFERAVLAMLRTMAPESEANPQAAAPAAGRVADVEEVSSCPAQGAVTRWHRPQATGRQRPVPDCGCTADAPCLPAWSSSHVPPIRPGLTWEELELSATQSALVREARSTGIAPEALRATKARPPRNEGGLWARAVAVWNLHGPLASRVHGVPVVAMAPCWRLVVDGDPVATGRTAIFPYQDDAHITEPSLAGPGGQAHATAARQEVLRWAGDERLRETAVSVALEGIWTAFLEAAQRRPGGHREVPRYDVVSVAERQIVLTVETTIPHIALLHDADEWSLDDLALSQAYSAYSDLGSDLRRRVLSNGLLVGAGLDALPGMPGAPAAYRALSRSLLAAARSRPHTPASQVVAWTAVWNAANGRHRIAERAAGLPYEWLAHRWPTLQADQDDWDAVEQGLCTRIYERLRNDGLLPNGRQTRCDHCGQLPAWAAAVHTALPEPAEAACAITRFITGTRVHDSDPDCPGTDRTPASEFSGAIALLVHRYLRSGALYDLGWLLHGAIWFHEALHLRACIVDLIGGGSDQLSPEDW